MLQIKKIYKQYGRKEVLNNLSLSIPKGEILGFIGPNGAGKTTTIKIVVGLLSADSGEVYIDGVNGLENTGLLKEKIGYVPDFFGVYDNLRVLEYLDFFCSIYGIEGRAAKSLSYKLLDLVGLNEKEELYVDHLSRGMKQRLCLARAMIHSPSMLVLDEPTSGLDPINRVEFKKIVRDLRDEGITILISSHILSELSELCTSLGVIQNGELLLQGKIDDILLTIDASNPLNITVYNRLEDAVLIVKRCPHVRRLSIMGNVIAAEFTGSREEEGLLLRELVTENILVTSYTREQGSLESIFLHITNDEEETK